MKISVEVFNPKKTFKRIFSDEVRKYAHTRLHAYCSPYVPMDSGALDQTVDITPNYVHYKSPYDSKPGSGGAGGKGGAGADGCIILYYGVTTPVQDGQLKDKNGLMLLDKYGRRLIV